MTLAQLSGFVLILIMIRMVYDTTRFVSGVSFMGNGIYHITVNAWFRGNYIYRQWLKNNSIYHWCILFIIALCPTILLLIEPFRENRMFERPEASLVINIILWWASYKMNRWFFRNNRK